MKLTDSLRYEYQHLFDSCVINGKKTKVFNRVINMITKQKPRYQRVSHATGVPWHMIAIIHLLESGGKFDRHLHNGDSLSDRTVNVPKNRPLAKPPFTWEASAIDAMRFMKMDTFDRWGLAETLYRLESYNGFGYRSYHPKVLTPYLWSMSNHYTSGKYTHDGSFKYSSISRQCGAACILKELQRRGIVHFDKSKHPYPSELFKVGVPCSGYVRAIQHRLNSKARGGRIQEDGYFGQATGEKVKAFQWEYVSPIRNDAGVDGIVGKDTWTALFK